MKGPQNIYEELYVLMQNPRDIGYGEMFDLWSLTERTILDSEPTAATVAASIHGWGVAESKRRNCKVSDLYKTPVQDVRWGVLSAGKKYVSPFFVLHRNAPSDSGAKPTRLFDLLQRLPHEPGCGVDYFAFEKTQRHNPFPCTCGRDSELSRLRAIIEE